MKLIGSSRSNAMHDVLVVGSGLAAYGACLALIKRHSISVTVIDIGLDKSYPDQPNLPVPNSIKYNGSLFPYGINDNRLPFDLESNRMCSSHAIGGFSKVYSGSILQPKGKDLIGWPDESKPTASDYNAVLSSLRIWQIEDFLSEGFPCYPNPDDPVVIDRTFVGAPRIALNKVGDQNAPFDTSYSFQKWAKDGILTYIPNHYVVQLSQVEDKVLVSAISNNRSKTLWFDYVYLAAGCVNTTAIVDRSLNHQGDRIYSIKSAKTVLQLYLKFPFMPKKNLIENRSSIRNPDLCKIFVEHRSTATSDTWSHTQINSFNRTIVEALGQKFPPIIRDIILILKGAFRFSITVFHSSLEKQSALVSSIIITPSNEKLQTVRILEADSECSTSLSNTIRWAIVKNFFSLGLLPLPFSQPIVHLMKGNRLGGWHYGGTLPMTEGPSNTASLKPNGELNGLSHVYVIDSSGFPSIPGSTVALLTMTNAYRIARNSISNLKP